MWSEECQGHRQIQHRTGHKGHTPSPRIEIQISDSAGNRTWTTGLEGRDSADHATDFFTARFYRDCHLLEMSNCRSSNLTAICWATSEVVHHFVDNNGFGSRETVTYIVSSGIWVTTRHLSLKITNSLVMFRLRKPLKKPQAGWSATGFEPGTSRMRFS